MATSKSSESTDTTTTSKVGTTTTDAESKGGNPVTIDEERYNEAVKSQGGPTAPSGQGGKTPRTTPDHQDMFPPNPEPSEAAKKKAEELDKEYEERHG